MLLAVGLACLVFQWWLPGQAVAESDYQAVAQVLEAEAKPGDVVLLHPWWTERARIFTPERLPVVGYQGSADDSLELHARIWVLAQPGLPRADWSGFLSRFGQGRTAIGAPRQFGRLWLQAFENGKYRAPRWDAASALAGARVYLESPEGGRSECRWDGRAHRCPNGAEVAAEWHEIRFQPRRCIKLFPPGGPTKLVAEFPSAAAAPVIALRAGLIWDRGYFHMPELTPVDVGVDLNGAAALALTVPVGVEGVLPADGPAIPEGGVVRVWSRSHNPSYRELCVELYAMEQPR